MRVPFIAGRGEKPLCIGEKRPGLVPVVQHRKPVCLGQQPHRIWRIILSPQSGSHQEDQQHQTTLSPAASSGSARYHPIFATRSVH